MGDRVGRKICSQKCIMEDIYFMQVSLDFTLQAMLIQVSEEIKDMI